MLNIKTILAVIGLGLTATAAANAPQTSLLPVYIEGSQYSAVLDQSAQRWRLLPADGIDLDVSAITASCASDQSLPVGLWLLTRGADGKASLTAPSATPLPVGHPEEVPLLGCGERSESGPYANAPQGLIDWLANSGGAILVNR
ncbi:MAG: hypothetical protein R3F01_07945 [Lysobacteraceae bacterium]